MSLLIFATLRRQPLRQIVCSTSPLSLLSLLPGPPEPSPRSFTLAKRARDTDLPLAGARYTLYLNGQAAAAAISDASGSLHFADLSPGSYDLVETQAPAGYRARAALPCGNRAGGRHNRMPPALSTLGSWRPAAIL